MKYYSLSTSQRNIWNLQKFYEGTSIGNQCGAIFYKNNKCEELLQKALNRVIFSQSGMRLRFQKCDGAVQQYVEEFSVENFEVLNFDSFEEYENYATKFALIPMEMINCAMYKIKIINIRSQFKCVGILMLLHHMIADAWSFGLVAKLIDEAYQDLLMSNEEKIERYDYCEFLKNEKQYFSSQKYRNDELYWKEKYREVPENTVIKIDTAQTNSAKAKRYTIKFPYGLYNIIDKWCKKNKTTPAVLFETILLVYLKKINLYNKRISIGVLTLNRINKEQKKTAGTFISTLPLTIEVNSNEEIRKIIKKVVYEHYDLFRHQRYPYDKIVTNIRKCHDINYPLYNVLFSYQNSKTNVDATTQWFNNGYSEVAMAVHIDDRDGEGNYTLNVDYRIDIFDEKEIKYIIKRMDGILNQVLENADLLVNDSNFAHRF